MQTLLLTTTSLFLIVFCRYLLFSGGAWLLCYVWKKEKWANRRIQTDYPDPAIIRREKFWSILTCLIFAVTGTAMLAAWEHGYTRIYLNIQDYGWTYFFCSLFFMAVFHDTYFYWTHRWMHQPRLYRLMHKVHHDSRIPSPWAAFSFHPLESLIAAVILPALIFIIPVHPAALLLFLMFMTFLGVVNHLGYELYPASFNRHWFFKWWISATHHQMHHRSVTSNYGLYFTGWDHLMGTHHHGYENFFDEIKARSREIKRPTTATTALATLVAFLFFLGPLPAQTSGLPIDAIQAELKLKLEGVRHKCPCSKHYAEEARLLYFLGKYAADDQAKKLFLEEGFVRAGKARALDSKNPAAWHWWIATDGELLRSANPLQALKSLPELELAMIELKNLDPGYGHAAADRALGNLYELAPPLISIGSTRKAEESFRAAMKRYPDFPGNQAYYAKFLLSRGECKQARSLASDVTRRLDNEKPPEGYELEAGDWLSLANHVLEKTQGRCP